VLADHPGFRHLSFISAPNGHFAWGGAQMPTRRVPVRALREIANAIAAERSTSGATVEVGRAQLAVTLQERIKASPELARYLAEVQRGNPMSAPLGRGPGASVIRNSGPVFRAAYLIRAAQRIAAAEDEAEQKGAESRHFRQHQGAQIKRELGAMRLDAAQAAYGRTLGWYATLDERTTAECRAAHGRNFDVRHPPTIGLPGIGPHHGCRCTPGAPHARAGFLPSGTPEDALPGTMRTTAPPDPRTVAATADSEPEPDPTRDLPEVPDWSWWPPAAVTTPNVYGRGEDIIIDCVPHRPYRYRHGWIKIVPDDEDDTNGPDHDARKSSDFYRDVQDSDDRGKRALLAKVDGNGLRDVMLKDRARGNAAMKEGRDYRSLRPDIMREIERRGSRKPSTEDQKVKVIKGMSDRDLTNLREQITDKAVVALIDKELSRRKRTINASIALVSGDTSPFSSSKTSNWVARRGGLPGRVRAIARAVKRKHPDWPLSRCIAVAINAVKHSAATGDVKGLPGRQNERASTVAAHSKAAAQWAAMKASSGKGKRKK
jgi:hypothetical protein